VQTVSKSVSREWKNRTSWSTENNKYFKQTAAFRAQITAEIKKLRSHCSWQSNHCWYSCQRELNHEDIIRQKMQRLSVFLVCCSALLSFIRHIEVEAKCSSGSSTKTCRHGSEICPACIDVSWLIRPPFTIKRGNTTEGILPGNPYQYLNSEHPTKTSTDSALLRSALCTLTQWSPRRGGKMMGPGMAEGQIEASSVTGG